MTKGHEQLLRVSDAACAKCLLNIVDDHCADRFAAMGCSGISAKAQAAIRRCRLLLSPPLRLAQTAKAMQSSKEIMTPSSSIPTHCESTTITTNPVETLQLAQWQMVRK